MNRYIIKITIVFLLLGTYSYAQKINKKYATFNEELAIGIGNDSIAAYALIAAGKQPKETIILLHGIPGNERNLDLAQDLRAAGKNVIFFSYRGAWGSQGKYLYSNCLEDIDYVLNYFSDPSIVSKMRIDSNKIVLIGHSLGGGLALIKAAKDTRVKKAIALSAANFGGQFRNITTVDSLKGWQNYIKSSFMLNCNPKEFLQELIDNKIKYNIISYKQELSTKDVLIIDDFNRLKGWPGKLGDSVEYYVIESDHSFTNKRTELSNYILKWLQKN